MAKNTMLALKPFPFKGVQVQVDEEIEPDNDDQAKLLETIGLASFKRRTYRTRAARPQQTAVLTTPDV